MDGPRLRENQELLASKQESTGVAVRWNGEKWLIEGLYANPRSSGFVVCCF